MWNVHLKWKTHVYVHVVYFPLWWSLHVFFILSSIYPFILIIHQAISRRWKWFLSLFKWDVSSAQDKKPIYNAVAYYKKNDRKTKKMFVNFLCRRENSFDREKKKTQRTPKKGPSRNSEFDKSVSCIVSGRASLVVIHVHAAFNWYLHVFIYLQARFT